jgi:hypothetical protein
MSSDSVRIDPDAAGAALRAWQASVDELRSAVRRRSTAIGAAEAARPWGGDAGGQQFGTSYAEGADPSRAAVVATVDQLEDLGRSVGSAVQASVESDEQQAAALQPAQDALDPR